MEMIFLQADRTLIFLGDVSVCSRAVIGVFIQNPLLQVT